MPGQNVLSDALGAMDWGTLLSQTIYWVGWGLLSVIIIAAMIAVYMFMTYNIKVTQWKLYGSGKDGAFAFSTPKWNRVKWIKKRTAWRALLPLFNSKDIEPFDQEYQYPGSRIYTFILNNEWIPGRVNIDKTENEIRAEINPVPICMRNWQSLQHKKNAMEFAKHTFWDDNKTLIMATIMGFGMLAAGLAFIWMTYKLAGAGASDISALTSALRNWGSGVAGNAPR